jgi:hypothetical protein
MVKTQPSGADANDPTVTVIPRSTWSRGDPGQPSSYEGYDLARIFSQQALSSSTERRKRCP